MRPICPNHLNLDILMKDSIFGSLSISYISLLYLILHVLPTCTPPKILLSIFLSKIAICEQVSLFKVHDSDPYVATGLIRVLYMFSLISLVTILLLRTGKSAYYALLPKLIVPWISSFNVYITHQISCKSLIIFECKEYVANYDLLIF